MTYREVRSLYMKNERRVLAGFGAWYSRPDQEFFRDVWSEMSYYDRVKTAQRLSRPGAHCLCLPTCIHF